MRQAQDGQLTGGSATSALMGRENGHPMSKVALKTLAVGVITLAGAFGVAPTASATLHPIVESADCAQGTVPHGDVASPPGQSVPGTPSDHRALVVTSDGFTDFSSPAWFGHKLDGQCGRVGR